MFFFLNAEDGIQHKTGRKKGDRKGKEKKEEEEREKEEDGIRNTRVVKRKGGR